jgi:hypothetical protein
VADLFTIGGSGLISAYSVLRFVAKKTLKVMQLLYRPGQAVRVLGG